MRSGGRGDAIPLIQFFKMPRPVGGVIHYQDEDKFIGWFEDFPDYRTQGETLDELKENLNDI
jgi:hypothetical protein